MARQTNGIDQYLRSASAINMSAYTKGAYAFWLWWDTNGSDGDVALMHPDSGTPRVNLTPNHSSGSWEALYVDTATSNGRITQPSAAAWHHIVVNIDLTKASSEIDTIYVDGSSVSVSRAFDGDNAGNLANATLDLMSVQGLGNFGAGRIAEVALYGGIILSGSDVSSLYNGGNGALATSVQNASLKFYWRILGTTSPEPNTVGGVDLNVTGATLVAHPFSDAGTPTASESLGARGTDAMATTAVSVSVAET